MKSFCSLTIFVAMLWSGCIIPSDEVLPRPHVTVVKGDGSFDYPGEMTDVVQSLVKMEPGTPSMMALGVTDRSCTGAAVARHALFLLNSSETVGLPALVHVIVYVLDKSSLNITDAVMAVTAAVRTRIMRIRFGAFHAIDDVLTPDDFTAHLVLPNEVPVGVRMFNVMPMRGLHQDTQQYGRHLNSALVLERFSRIL